MKRPRRPTKKTARKVVRKRKTKVVRRRTPRTFFSKSDPFYLDAKLIPAGWAYQWSTYVDPKTGWRPVPYSRHAHDFPKIAQSPDGFILIEGLTLAEIPAATVKAELQQVEQKSRDLIGDFDRRLGRDNVGKGFYILSPQFIVEREITAEMAHTEGPPVEVTIPLTMRVPQRWSAAAATLDLKLEEYTLRRILMERPVLGSMEFPREYADVVYEPVNLQFTPVPKES